MIEQFREIELAADRDTFLQLRERMIALTHGTWRYLRDRELDFMPDGTSVLFAHRGGPLPDANLSVAWYDARVSIGNIVPEDSGQLTMREYNTLLVDFHDRCLGPAAEQLGLELIVTPDRQDLTHWISANAARKLEIFSSLANKGSAASHPMDRERWLDFIICVHEGGTSLPQEVLQKWLIDELRWPDTTAADLASDFGEGIELLERYDDRR